MSITGFIILYAVMWFVALWIIIPIGLRTQSDDGVRTEGTMSGSPTNFKPKRAYLQATFYSFIVWVIVVGIIVITDFDYSSFDIFGIVVQPSETVTSQ